MNLLPLLENGLFALGQVLRFPVFALLWVCVIAAVFMAGSCVVDFVARRRERRTFDITAWLKSGPAIQAPAARVRLLPASLRQMLSDVDEAHAQGALGDVDDTRKMGLPELFDKNSPFAYQDITARMLETVRKGYWKADAATEKKLLEEYVESVNRHGVGCAEHTCGNPRLQQYVMERGLRAGIPVPSLEGFKREMEKATGQEIDPAAEREEAFSRQNDAQMAARLAAVPAPGRNARQLEGYLMEERDRSAQSRNDTRQDAPPSEYAGVVASLPVLGVRLAWRWTRRLCS